MLTFGHSAARPETRQQRRQRERLTAAARDCRRERYALLDTTRRLFPGSRTAICGRVARGGSVRVVISVDGGRASFRDVLVCGSVWSCPVCAARISEVRKHEVQDAIDRFMSEPGPHTMLLETRTVRHHRFDNLAELNELLRRARRIYKASRVYKECRRRLCAAGAIRNLEVTYGENGWHPHEHELVFCQRAIDANLLTEIETALGELWRRCCVAVGLRATNEHGLTLQAGEQAGKYLAKWGAAAELTKSHLKRGGRGGRTPWDLLRAAHDGDAAAGRLWIDFAKAFKGSRQLTWSPGLRARLGIDPERSDEEIADGMDTPVETVAEIDARQIETSAGSEPSDWCLVTGFKAQPVILDAAEITGAPGITRVLARLRELWRDGVFAFASRDTNERDVERPRSPRSLAISRRGPMQWVAPPPRFAARLVS